MDPLPPPDPLGGRQRAGRVQARVLDHPRLGLGRDRSQIDRGHARIPGPGDQPRDPLGDDPVDHGAISSSRWSVSSERAATTGDDGAASSGAASGLRAAGEADESSRLADDQLARGGVDAARPPQRQHSVEPPGGDLAEGRGDRPQRAQPVADRLEPVDRGLHPARVGRLDPEHLEAAVGPHPLLERRVERLAVQRRSLAALRPPLLTGPEVVHERVNDVRHRVAGGDGDRQRVVRNPSLRVQRPVDRIDDHLHRGIAVVDLAALLRERGEAVALVAQPVELCQHDRLGSAVDHERAVAAPAPLARLDRPLGGRRDGRENLIEARDRAAANCQPICVEGRAGRGHDRTYAVRRGDRP